MVGKLDAVLRCAGITAISDPKIIEPHGEEPMLRSARPVGKMTICNSVTNYLDAGEIAVMVPE
jgi:hypothetical protein